MSSDEVAKGKGNGRTTLSDFFKDISPNQNFTEYLKRFFYQIIGIYFPATVLFLYIFLFWYVSVGVDKDPINYYSQYRNSTWPEFLHNNLKTLEQNIGYDIKFISVILFVVAIVILGEGINAITSRFTMLSPVITSKKERIEFSIRNKSFPGIYDDARWPIWLNETSFPVSFSQFDRYYVSALEQDKRILAGKIGWVSFYRNMVAVFGIILALQVFLTLITYMNIHRIYGYESYIIVVAILAIFFLLFGYRAQIKSNEAIFWDAYKRYQLRKNLEIRYGDLTLSFGIKDEHKTRAIEYMVDRWFLGVDNTIQTISRYLLTKLEQKYKKIFKCMSSLISPSNLDQRITDNQLQDDLITIEKKLKKILTDSYSHWNRGAYERVVKDTLVAFREINKFQRKHQEDLNRKCKTSSAITGQFQNHGLSENKEEWNDEPTEEDWKTILGFYLLENSLRTDAAFVEISKNISNWGWTIQDTKELIKNTGNSNNEHISKFTTPEENTGEELTKEKELSYYYIPNPNWNKIRYDQMANIIRETSDPYQMAYFQIMNTFEKMNSLLNENKLNDEQKDKCFEKLRKIYCLFGGYEYIQAFEKAKKFFEGIYQNGSANVTLKSNGFFYRPSFSGDITKEDAAIPEGAFVTEIINGSSLKLTHLLHIDENNKKEEFSLDPYFTLKINEQEKKVYVIGQWNVQYIDADYYSLPKEINLKVKWKSPIIIQ